MVEMECPTCAYKWTRPESETGNPKCPKCQHELGDQKEKIANPTWEGGTNPNDISSEVGLPPKANRPPSAGRRANPNPVTLEHAFNVFAKGKPMDGKTFSKFMKDCEVMNKKCTSTTVDMEFAKLLSRQNPKGRTIVFAEFEQAIAALAKVRKLEPQALIDIISKSKGPQFSGTKADDVRFHDDKTTYTGTHTENGACPAGQSAAPTAAAPTAAAPTAAAPTAAPTAAAPTAAAPAAEGEKKAAEVETQKIVLDRQETLKITKLQARARGNKAREKAKTAAENIEEVFKNLCKKEEAVIDGKTFFKFSKDCKLLNKKCTQTDIDIIFSKIKDKSARKITFGQFQAGVAEIATKRGDDLEALKAKILKQGGKPNYKGTQADAVRLNDDKSTFTGVHANGGPSTIDASKGLENLLDRSDADARGVKK